MTKSRMKDILDQVVSFVSSANNTQRTIEELLQYGFWPEELISDFDFSKSDVEEVCGPSSDEEETVSVQVFRDTVAPELHGDTGITEIEVRESLLLEWFKETIKEKIPYKGDKTDRQLLDDWLDRYTAMETTGLYDWIKAREWDEQDKAETEEYIRANEEMAAEVLRLQKKDEEYVLCQNLLKDSYVRAYQNALKRETEKLEKEGSKDPAYYAQMTWEDGASDEEIAGYYIANEGDNAYISWMQNLSHVPEKDRTDLDIKVTKLLAALFPESSRTYICSETLNFASAEEMGTFLQDGDLYNPIIGTYVYGYNDEGAIHVYTGIDVEAAEYFASRMKELDEIGWSAVMPAGGQIYGCDEAFDHPGESEASRWCSRNYAEFGWVKADENTFASPKPAMDPETSQQWIVSISGSELYDVITDIVCGTEDEVRNYLVTCVQSDRNTEKESWVQGTEKAEEIQVNKNGKLYAQGMHKTYHMDYTAVPMSSLSKKELATPFGN